MGDSLTIAGVIQLLGRQASTLPQCPGAIFTLAPGFNLGAPQPQTDVVAEMIVDGERPVGRRSGNRTVSMDLVITGPSRQIISAAREILLQLIDADTWQLTWDRDPGGQPMILDCYRAQATQIPYSLTRDAQLVSLLTITFEAAPFGRSDLPVTLQFASPAIGYSAPPSPVTLDVYSSSGGWATGWSRSAITAVGTYSAHWDEDTTAEVEYPSLTRSFSATDISAQSSLSLWVGLGADDSWTRDVTFSIVLADNSGHHLTAGVTRKCTSSDDEDNPYWQQVTLALPPPRSFDLTHVTGYTFTAWARTGDLLADDCYLDTLRAVPTSSAVVPSVRGTVYTLLGIQGSARAPVSLTVQPGGSGAALVTGDNSTFEGGIGNWIGATGTPAVAQTSAQAHGGSTASLSVTAAGAGNMAAASCSAASILTQGFACAPGQVVVASVWFRAATVGRSCQVGIGWYDSGGTIIGVPVYGTAASDSTTGWVNPWSGYLTAPAGAVRFRIIPLIQSAAGAGEIHYVDDVTAWAPFRAFIAHRPGPDAPALLSPMVDVGDGADVPNGGTEYVVPQPVARQNARFYGTYTVVLASSSISTPTVTRNVKVTVKQYESSGGPATSVTAGGAAGVDIIPTGGVSNSLWILGEVTLPARDIDDSNTACYYTVTVDDSNESDRFTDVLFLDAAGQTAIIGGIPGGILDSGNGYPTYYLDEPGTDTDLGQCLASNRGRAQAVSVTDSAILTGGPLTADPGDNPLLMYSPAGQPAVSVTYMPRWMADRPQ
jgi:hypothetical protein